MTCRLFFFIFATVSAISIVGEARSGEFGNIIDPRDPQTEQSARVASARALQSLQKIFTALEKSELRQIPARREALRSAAELLLESAKEMSLVSTGGLSAVAINYERMLPRDRDLLQRVLPERFGNSPKDLQQLYRIFTNATANLGKFMYELATSELSVLPPFDSELNFYLNFGFAVSRVSERLRQ